MSQMKKFLYFHGIPWISMIFMISMIQGPLGSSAFRCVFKGFRTAARWGSGFSCFLRMSMISNSFHASHWKPLNIACFIRVFCMPKRRAYVDFHDFHGFLGFPAFPMSAIGKYQNIACFIMVFRMLNIDGK